MASKQTHKDEQTVEVKREETTTREPRGKSTAIMDAIQRLREEEKQVRGASAAGSATTAKGYEAPRVSSPDGSRRAPTSTDPVPHEEHHTRSSSFSSMFKFSPSSHAMAMYCRQLATLVDVGIPLLEALRILARRGSNKRLASVSGYLARRVEEGVPLSVAMADHPSVFSPMFVGVVRAGEAGGILDESLRRLADLLERRAALRSRVVSALWYPAIALALEVIIIAIIVLYAMPKLLSAYPDHSQLPGPTLALLGISNFVGTWWPLLLVLLIAVIVGIAYLLRTSKGRSAWDRTKLYIPGVGNLSRKINVARFSRTLGNLTAAGIPLIDALDITAATADNAVVTPTLYRVRSAVERGEKMDNPMRSEPIFDDVVVDMVMVGDEAGALDTTLLKIADTYDLEVDASLRRMTAILEPLLIVLLGVSVAIIALAVFLPYFKLVNSPALMVE